MLVYPGNLQQDSYISQRCGKIHIPETHSYASLTPAKDSIRWMEEFFCWPSFHFWITYADGRTPQVCIGNVHTEVL